MQIVRVMFLFFCFIMPLSASDKVTVFVIHSYSHEYKWTKKQHDAFVSKINAEDKTLDYYVEYLDTKRAPLTAKSKNVIFEHIQTHLSSVTPDAIYVTDDNALEFVYENYSKLFGDTASIPVFFSGINNLDMEAILPKNIFRGVYEIKEIEPNIELIKQFSPQTRDIYIIGDNSNTYKAIEQTVNASEKKFPNLSYHYISYQYLSEVIKELPTTGRNFAILTTIGAFKDEINLTIPPKESIRKLKHTENLSILTMEDAYMYEGVLGGYVTSGNKQGEEAAKLLLKYLEAGSLETVKSIKNSSNIYFFDAQELVKARVLLSEYIRRIALITHNQKDFVEDNKVTILELLVLILLFILFTLTALYAIQRKNNLKNSNKNYLIDKLKVKLASKENLLRHIIEEENLAYWTLDLHTKKVQLSQELIAKLQIDIEIYKDDRNLMTYFIHFNDKKLFFDKIEEIKSSRTHLHFQHRMINAHNEILHVKHVLYYETTQKATSPKILGILKFEE